MFEVTISTDGACSGNPGPGGWAAILRMGSQWLEVSGFEPNTSNNRMEMTAAIKAIEQLKKPCDITVRTDSMILINAIENMESRSKNGWKTKTGAQVANRDLHERLFNLVQAGNHVIRCEHVTGHNGDPDNERCDSLAREAIADNIN